MATDLIELVRRYSVEIEDNRTPNQILKHLKGEVDELHNEVFTDNPGPDGIAGEAIDVIVCALDLIFTNNPEMSNETIVEYARKKCDKWKNKAYS